MAKQVFDNMPKWDLVSYNALIAAYAQNADISYWDILYHAVTSFTCESGFTIITAYAQYGHIEESKSMFENMPERNLLAWNAMLVAYAQLGYADMSRHLFQQIPQRDVISWNSLLFAHASTGNVPCTEKMLARLPEENLTSWNAWILFQRQHYCCIVDLLARGGYLEDAEDLIANMPFVPEPREWLCLLGSCRSHRDVDRGAHRQRSAVD
ncbi:pentatricopeptide repeat-containing protein At2g13600-like [Selaginella moellendorffii]|uniref:pentatricopeptide repeat-containing protein At2g13600-like n=1 Tax=Selaginella moellendorffii TaxID=88036 RepID=UPI000D1C5192|nr:pentatricopeptide repeat-containing protein At2g13600-like [Selaginella moellendorffii]|eukprot:XP_024533238.1 pentatricopeptide repeat-containing protein At2g13600-like [Selaginella moellendorffii]